MIRANRFARIALRIARATKAPTLGTTKHKSHRVQIIQLLRVALSVAWAGPVAVFKGPKLLVETHVHRGATKDPMPG